MRRIALSMLLALVVIAQPPRVESSPPDPAPPAWACGSQRPLRILIVYADLSEPTVLRTQLQQNPAVGVVDVYDAGTTVPQLRQLLAYDVVVAFSFSSWSSPGAIGDVLADYIDRLGIVVGFNISWSSGSYLIQGRWLSGGYSPYEGGGTNLHSNGTLGAYTVGHPLMEDITALNAYLRQTLVPSSGAVQIAAWNDGPPLLVTKGRAVGVSAYVGSYYTGQASGDFDHIVVNAGHWLAACKTYTPLIR